MIFIERIRELFLGLLPGKTARSSDQAALLQPTTTEANPRVNPWTQDLERLACYTQTEPVESCHSDSGEVKIQLLMEQARLEKAKEVLRQQMQQRLQQQQSGKTDEIGEQKKTGTKRKTRTTDATIVDGKAWWGQAVATWDPDDAKNLGPQGEIRHPRQHKWFNQ